MDKQSADNYHQVQKLEMVWSWGRVGWERFGNFPWAGSLEHGKWLGKASLNYNKTVS